MKKLLLSFTLSLFLYASSGQTLVTNTPVLDGSIQAVIKYGNTVYVGGTFDTANGVAHEYLFRYDATTGAVDDSWVPEFDGIQIFITTLRIAGTKLIVGGRFETVNGQDRQNICMFDLVTGNLDSWNNISIYSWSAGIGTEGDEFYYVNATSSVLEGYLQGVNAMTGTNTGWQSQYELNGDVNAVAVSDNYVYAGGQFSLVNAPSSNNNSLCRFDKVTGVLDTTWQPEVDGGNFGITQIAVSNGKVWVGFTGDMVGTETRKGIAYFDEADGSLGPFDQTSSSYEVFGVMPIGENVWVAGNSWQLGGATRWKIAQINIDNSEATCWDASAITYGWGYANSVYVAGDTVYIGPSFTVISGTPVPQVFAADITGPTSVAISESATYSVPNTSGFTYSWNVIGGTGSSSTNSIDVTWGTGPSGVLQLVVNNTGEVNCHSDTISLNVSIGSVGTNSTTPNSSFDVYPNLTTGTIQIAGVSPGTPVEIMDVAGRTLLDFMLDASGSVDMSAFSQGIYLVKTPFGVRRICRSF